MKIHKGIAFLCVWVLAGTVYGQSVSSVYSNRGIGLINTTALPHNMGMGEVGIGVPSTWSLNYQNPAFLTMHNFTLFQVGIEMDRRRIESSTIDARKVSGGLRYLNLAFPVMAGKWVSAIGISPYSTVNNQTFSESTVTDDVTAVTTYEGSGGLTAFNWSNGFRVGKNLTAGIRTSVLFGSINTVENSLVTEGSLQSYNVEFTDRSSYSGMKFDLALGYRHFMGDEKALNFGLVYELSQEINGTHDQWMQSGLFPRLDILQGEEVSYKLPSSVGFGFSYQLLNKLTLGSDVTYTNWSTAGNDETILQNTYKIAVGGQFIPDYASVSSYFKRVTYRFGVNFGSLPYVVNGTGLNEFGINFGTTLPVGASNLDLAMKYGRLGTLENDLIRETFFRIVIGATINDRWFIKRRYD